MKLAPFSVLFAAALLFVQSPPLQADGLEGRPGINALRIDAGAIKIDAKLDESPWQTAQPASGFIQRYPKPGERATEETEVRVLYDEENLYIGAVFHDSSPEGIIADEMRWDANLSRNDSFEVIIDTYHDHRNGFYFATNPLGARSEALVANEGGSVDFDWNGVWWVAAAVTPRGWQVEMKIPFSTLRFDKGMLDTWGIQFSRVIRRKNEDVYWASIPLDAGIERLSMAGHLHGLQGARQGRHIEVKPYVLLGVERLPTRGRDDTGVTEKAGVDLKYSITPNLTADLTVNTDFAQVEADEQQINLTRFPLFFPEKREFFLEGSGFFDFGLRGSVQPFFSRRIGLAAGEAIPILAGGKLSGKAGNYGIGLLSVQTKEKGAEPETNYTVLRLKRDILARSTVGIIAVSKKPEEGAYNRTFGADLNLSLLDHLYLNSFLARSRTEGVSGDDTAKYVNLRWSDPGKYLTLSYLDVGELFNPEAGFVMRSGIKEASTSALFYLRPQASRVREYSFYALLKHLADQRGGMTGRNQNIGVTATFHSSDYLEIAYKREFDRLDFDFEISPGIVIPKGGYENSYLLLFASTDASRKVSGGITVMGGSYYKGDRVSYDGSILIKPTARLGLAGGFTREAVGLPAGSFTANLVHGKVEYAFTSRVFANALVQWNDTTRELSSNLRINYKYRPGSDVYLVYNERRDTDGRGLTDRALYLKLTYLWTL